MLLCILAAPALAATYATVVGGWLRLRANPSYNAKVITSYRSGTVVTVLSQDSGWARVLTSDYRVGYMDLRYLSFGSSPVITPRPTAAPSRTWYDVNRTAYVTSQNGRGVRLRSAPVVNSSNVLGLYPVGRTVTEIRRSSDGWSYIRIDKKYGYMMTKFLTTSYYPPGPPGPPAPTGHPGPAPTATPTPVPTATPTPASKQIQSVKLSPYHPTVGDTIGIIVTPANAEYTAVWYNSDNTLLSTSKQYTVRASDAGKTINVRIMGVGESAGFVADASTSTVETPPSESTGSSDPIVQSEWVDELFNTP